MQILVPERQPRRRLNLMRWLLWGVFIAAGLAILAALAPLLLPLINGDGKAR